MNKRLNSKWQKNSMLSGNNVNGLEIPSTLKSSQNIKIMETTYGWAFGGSWSSLESFLADYIMGIITP